MTDNNLPDIQPQLIDESVLNIIKGRQEPHIYAFRIDTFPPSYKIGDTFREVDVRIDEWRKIYCGLPFTYDSRWKWSAMVEENFFRDHAVHRYLEEEKGRKAMGPEAFGPYHISSEFYLDTEIKDIDDAVDFIRINSNSPTSSYKLYSAASLKEVEKGYERNLEFKLRENQEKVVNNFLKACDKGRKKMLMYAVMRFGKTFTALCCAKRKNLKSIIVVSAKADVASEWKRNVQGITEFKNFKFFDKKNLNSLDIDKEIAEGNTVVVFVTLQDIQGPTIKAKHKKIFEARRKWGMVIVDETHFGARAPKYGVPLYNVEEDKVRRSESLDELDKELKSIKRQYTLHLSGTPYRILMTNEFNKDEIIACVRYPDILKARDDWFDSHVDVKTADGQPIEEWNNPYFGFPQMVRFAFNLNEESLSVIGELEAAGASVKFSELFKPLSIAKDNKGGKHRKFHHEREVLSFLQAIDGTKDDKNVLGFLDNERIKQGKLCHHIVMVLPFKASCDAMATLIEANRDKFKNLSDYEILNITGHDSSNNVQTLAHKISEYEANGQKTLSLTVNKMLTGVTVPEWDTMIYLRESFSPEEYDQATFRLQNQFIKTYRNSDGTIVKYDMKPQTLLVDFDPQRMFRLQEQKCLIYSSTQLLRGKSDLQGFLNEELESSPVIFLDHHKLRQLDAADLMDEIRKYSQARGIPEEAETIPVDRNLLENAEILKAISGLNRIDSKGGITMKANAIDDEGDDGNPTKEGTLNSESTSSEKNKKEKDKENNLADKLASYFSLILYFAFLTSDRVASLKDVIRRLDKGENKRISRHLGLTKEVLEVIASSQSWTLLMLNNSINDTNYTGNRTDLSQDEMVDIVLKRCRRLSESEIITPTKTADNMVAMLPDNLFENNGIVLDIASKQGEFAVALTKRFGKKFPEACKTRIYSLCTSSLAYEFTRKTYKTLGLDVRNIISDKTSYDIIAPKLADKKNGKDLTIKDILGTTMKINTIIGNPPYHLAANGNAGGSDPIYHLFIELATKLSEQAILIHPGRFLFNAGRTPKNWNSWFLNNDHFKILNYSAKSSEIFPNVDLPGGVAISSWNNNMNFGHIGSFSTHKELNSVREKVYSNEFKPFSDIVYGRDLYKVTETLYNDNPALDSRQSKGHRYDLGTSAFDVFPELFFDNRPEDGEQYVRIYGRQNGERLYKWIKRSYIKEPDNFEHFKIIIPKSNGSGAIGEVESTPIIGQPIIGHPMVGHTSTFLSIGNFKTDKEAQACLKYIRSKFARALLGILKVTQDNTRETWKYIPLQDFTNKSTIDWSKDLADIDRQLYKIYQLSDTEIAFIESMIKPI